MHDIKRYAVPRTVEELTELLAGEEATLFAGGTDLMLQARAGVRRLGPVLVNINRLQDLRGISQDNGFIHIGALTTISEIGQSPLLEARAKILVDAADRFASEQIRNAATVGGNLCNASPAADMAIPLLLLDAEVELVSSSEGTLRRRTLPVADFFLGPGDTQLKPKEVLTSILFEIPGGDFVARFEKFGARPAMDISVISVGVAGVRDTGVLRRARVAFGAAAPTPLRGRKTEAAVDGRRLDGDAIATAGRIAAEEISPISDVRGSAWFRRHLTKTLTRRLLYDVR
jgi:CO/xanthine dehydrogenase FAD-binding subunit